MAEGALDVFVQALEFVLADLERGGTRLDLRQIQDVVNQRQQIAAGTVNRLGKLDLARRQIVVGIVGQLLCQHQQAVERRAQFMRHVGQEFGFVFG